MAFELKPATVRAHFLPVICNLLIKFSVSLLFVTFY